MAEDGPPPNATLYVKNLNEKVKIPALIDSLKEIFGEFGEIIDVVAKKNLKARGQAFIVYNSADEASEAMEMLQGFDLHDKPMTIEFAKSRSDATVKKEDSTEAFEAHKQSRLAEKERKKALEPQKPAKRPAADSLADRPGKLAKSNPTSALLDEMLPPNKILLIRDFPTAYGQAELTALFQRYDGFKEVRIAPIPGVAFVEYQDETGSTAAKNDLNGKQLGDSVLRVTYQKQ